MGEDKKRAGLFEEEFESTDFKEWQPSERTGDRANIDTEKVRKVAEKQGFTSREPKTATPSKLKPKKEPTDQINIRSKLSVIEEFKALSEAQEPKWPLGYTLERAVAALKRELKRD